MAEAAETSGNQHKPGSSEAVISFTTKLSGQYQVPEDDLVVPASLARYGLSEVVNRLLSFEKPVPFDFLVKGEFLRTTVAQYLASHKLSAEKTLTIEYVFALSEPEVSQVDEAPDWVSGIVALQASPSQYYAAVSYDGTVRLYDNEQSVLTVRMSDAALVGVAALPVDGGRQSHLLAACKDGSAKCCALDFRGKDAGAAPVAGSIGTLRGPGTPKALETVAINEDGTLLATAGWDNEILVWNAASELFSPAADGAANAGPKRKKACPKFNLQGHSQAVTCMHFGAQARYPFTLFSGSWDSSIRVWDIAAASEVCNWTVARAVTSFSVCPCAPPQMATSHEDGHVSFWDIRAPPHPTIQGAVSLDASAGLPLLSAQAPHSRLAAQVAWHPQDANCIASVGHDGNLVILDSRSPKMPLQSVHVGKGGPNPNKLLCVTWLSRSKLAVGGSDGKVVQVTTKLGSPPEDAS